MIPGLRNELVDIYGQMTGPEMARMRHWIGGKVRKIRTLRDCPEYGIQFRPFLMTDPDDPEFLICPTSADCGPIAKALQIALLSDSGKL